MLTSEDSGFSSSQENGTHGFTTKTPTSRTSISKTPVINFDSQNTDYDSQQTDYNNSQNTDYDSDNSNSGFFRTPYNNNNGSPNTVYSTSAEKEAHLTKEDRKSTRLNSSHQI